MVFFNYFTIVPTFGFSVAGATKRENKSLFLPLVELEARIDAYPKNKVEATTKRANKCVSQI